MKANAKCSHCAQRIWSALTLSACLLAIWLLAAQTPALAQAPPEQVSAKTEATVIIAGTPRRVVQFGSTPVQRQSSPSPTTPTSEPASKSPYDAILHAQNMIPAKDISDIAKAPSYSMVTEVPGPPPTSTTHSAFESELLLSPVQVRNLPAPPNIALKSAPKDAPTSDTDTQRSTRNQRSTSEVISVPGPNFATAEGATAHSASALELELAPSNAIALDLPLEDWDAPEELFSSATLHSEHQSRGVQSILEPTDHLRLAALPEFSITSHATEQVVAQEYLNRQAASPLTWSEPANTATESTGQASGAYHAPNQGELVPPARESQTTRTQTPAQQAPDWIAGIKFPMLRYSRQTELSLVDAIHNAIEFAPEIEILRADVGIRQAEITRQQAGFDWNQFLRANWDERNVPIGSDLDGAVNRLENHTLATTGGINRRNTFGGQLQLAQDLGLADSNSQFFNPQNQATARVALEYQQPLLQGAGEFVNTSRINIAYAEASASQEDFVAGLQRHILDVVSAYWELVSARGEFQIQKRSYERALETATVVANRRQLDINPVQSARAEATLASRRTEMLQSEFVVVFAQEQLLRLIFGPQFKESVNHEIIPVSDMLGPSRSVDVDMQMQLALQNRPEVKRSLQFIKRSAIEQGVAENQLLPLLGLAMSVSNLGLQGNRGLASALNDQWDLGDPTYGIGVSYALPVGNRAAKANLRQAQLRLRRFQKEFETTLADVTLEVRNASNTIVLNEQQREVTLRALELAAKELAMLQERARLLIDGDNVGQLYLDDLLQTQQRLAIAEQAYLNAVTQYALAQFELQRANGSLLRGSPLPIEASADRVFPHHEHLSPVTPPVAPLHAAQFSSPGASPLR